jgi:hypothetical protein
LKEKKNDPEKKNTPGKKGVKKGVGKKKALKKKGDGKNGLGKKKNEPEKKGEKKKGGRKKNALLKKGGKKKDLGKKNALLKKGWKNGCPAKTRGTGARNRRLVLKSVAGPRRDEARTECAECGKPAVTGGRGTAEIRPGRGTAEIAGVCSAAELRTGRGIPELLIRPETASRNCVAETPEAVGGRGTDEMRFVPAAKVRGGPASVLTHPELVVMGLLRGDWGGVGRLLKVRADGIDCERDQPENAGDLKGWLDVWPKVLKPRPPLPIGVNPDMRPEPPAREPKEPILCACEGSPRTTVRITMVSQVRRVTVHPLSDPRFEFTICESPSSALVAKEQGFGGFTNQLWVR